MPLSDSQLLSAFAKSSDEAAFAELVGRRIDFVYAAALRQVGGDAHRAEDISQEVFIKLARDAAKLARHPALLGWLCTTTRFAAIDAIRSERRRRIREEEAHAMPYETRGETDWQKLQPVLDEALTELPEQDREAVLARYFDCQPFAQIARDFGLTENAAQKRVDRALDRLRAALARRQVTSTTAALGLVLSSQPGIAAPLGLASSVAKSAVVASATGAGFGILAFMSTQKLLAALVVVAAAVGIGTAFVGAKSHQDAQAMLASSRQHSAILAQRVRDLEERGQAETRRVQLAEQENGKLLTAVQSLKDDAAAEAEPITSEMVSRRFKLAQELVSSGDPEAALRELLWCYDIGMPRISSMRAVRSSSVSLFAKLGERYPAALEALRERRDKAKALMLANENDYDAVTEYASINNALKNDAESIALFDQLPPSDRRRQILAGDARDYLVDQQRYKDALEGRPYSSISSVFELLKERPIPSDTPDLEKVKQEHRSYLASTTAKNIEMLAGSGDVAHAQELAKRLLDFDNSEGTKALIQHHATRAGHPGLLDPSASP